MFDDDLSRELSLSNVGCYSNQSFINHLFHADDTVLLAPSSASLQILLDTCKHYSLAHEMLFTSEKTVCMAMLPKCLRKLNVPTMFLNVKGLKWLNEHKYLGVFVNSCFNDDRDIIR